MKSTSPAAPFSRTTRNLERLEALRQRVNEARREQLRELRKLLLERLALHCALFKDLQPDHAENFPAVGDYDWLERWDVEDGELIACFEYTFRSERHGYDIHFPVRFLAEDGEAVMREEAKVLQDQRDAEGRARKEQAERNERAQLQHLLEKYPEAGRRESGP